MKVRLYLIKQRQRDMWWACSSEHSTGWCPNQPKQAFSPSELTREIRRLIDQGWFQDIEILQLSTEQANFPAVTSVGCGPASPPSQPAAPTLWHGNPS